MKKTTLLSLTVLLGLAFCAQAAVVNISSGDSIQAAIDASARGDIIVVAPGKYTESLTFPGHDITLTSTDPLNPQVVAATILEGPTEGGRRGAGRAKRSVVRFYRDETRATVLTGFTIQGGYGTRTTEMENPQSPVQVYIGGGVNCQNASPTITNNHIRDNGSPADSETEQGFGGGVATFNSDALILNNIFSENRTFLAGALYTLLGNPLVANNLFVDNTAWAVGGAYLVGGRFLNNTMVNNDPDFVIGHLYVENFDDQAPVQVQNNIIVRSPSGGGLYFPNLSPGPWFAYNNIWGNTPIQFVDPSALDNGQTAEDPQEWLGTHGNINANPRFVNFAEGDYRLLGESPCINAGDPDLEITLMDTDLDNQARIFAERVDMGAYEFSNLTQPVADAGPDQEVFVNQVVTLDGSASIFLDPNNPTQHFLWDQLSGPAVELSDPLATQPTFKPMVSGTYRFELLINDGIRTSDPDETVVNVVRGRPSR